MKAKLLFGIALISAMLVSCGANTPSNSDPVTVIDDLDNTVEYTRIYPGELPETKNLWRIILIREHNNDGSYRRTTMDIMPLRNEFGDYFPKYFISFNDPEAQWFESGKYSTTLPENSKHYIYGATDEYNTKNFSYPLMAKKCQMYVTRTDIEKNKYTIDIYMQFPDNRNEWLHHEGVVDVNGFGK